MLSYLHISYQKNLPGNSFPNRHILKLLFLFSRKSFNKNEIVHGFIGLREFAIFQGAFWGLMLSLVIGVIRLVLDFTYQAPTCGSGEEDNRPSVIKHMDFLHFAALLTVLSTILMVAISLLTEPRPERKVCRNLYRIFKIKGIRRYQKGRQKSLSRKTDKPVANKMKRKTNIEHTKLHWKLKLE